MGCFSVQLPAMHNSQKIFFFTDNGYRIYFFSFIKKEFTKFLSIKESHMQERINEKIYTLFTTMQNMV